MGSYARLWNPFCLCRCHVHVQQCHGRIHLPPKKTNKQLLQIEKQIDEIHHMTSHEHDHFQQQLERTCRDINMVEKTVMNQIEKVDRDHHTIEDAIHREIDQTKSYIDSRIDKVVLQGSILGQKEIIKG